MMGSTEKTKVCPRCGRELPLSEFYKGKYMKDGYSSRCKECYKAYYR